MPASSVEVLAAAIRERDALRKRCNSTGNAIVEIGQCLIDHPECILSDGHDLEHDLEVDYFTSFDDVKDLVQKLCDAHIKVANAYAALSDDEREIVPNPTAP